VHALDTPSGGRKASGLNNPTQGEGARKLTHAAIPSEPSYPLARFVLVLAGPDLLTFMPEISLIGAFSLADLRSLPKDAIDNMRKLYTES